MKKLIWNKFSLFTFVLFFTLFLSFSLQAQCSLNDSLALVAFYNATNGESWTDNSNWLVPGEPIEEWHGVTVNGGGCVIELFLPINNLTGEMPSIIGQLSYLQILVLEGNNLYGSLPSQIWNLSQLKRLHLDDNSLSGTISTALPNLTQLQRLELSRNNFSGEILPSLMELDQLRDLVIQSNNFYGTIPPEIGSHSYSLEIEGNNTLKFIFDSILLPDSTTNELGSHGFVKFKISQKTDLLLGSVIENSAAIFFDFNVFSSINIKNNIILLLFSCRRLYRLKIAFSQNSF